MDAGANGQKVIDIERGEKAERAKANIQMLLNEYPSPVSGTVGENYFRARGIVALPSAPEARFAPALPYWDGSRDHGSYPAVLLPMLNATTGEILNVLRIYLAPDGSGKLDLNDDDGRKLPPKKVIGRYDGCAMWFTGTSGELGEEIILCEGPEDALSLRMATGQTAVAAGSWHQLEKVAIPAGVKRIVIVPDDNSDPENPTKDNVGEKGLQRAARKFSKAGIEIFVARVPGRKDSNAVLCDEGPEGGVDGLRRIIQRRAPYSAPNLEDQVSNAIKKNWRLAQAVFDDEVEIILDKRYLVKRLIEPGTLCALYGPSTVGKTFLALDLAAHIAHGKPLAERPTERAPVLYCALEGAAGVDRRMAAIVTAMGASDRRLARYDGYLTFGMDRSGSDSENALIKTCKEIEAKIGEPVALIVIDTLWCAMGGADENSAKDMGVVVARLKRIAEATGAAILVVHHPGKDGAKGMRGSSSLFAACDCVLRAFENNNKRRVWIEKSKDDLTGPLFTYELKPVSLGKDAEGEEITSCIVEIRLPGKVEEIKRERPPPTEPHGKALNELEHLILDGKGEELKSHERIPDHAVVVRLDLWVEACRKKGLAHSTTDNPDHRRRADEKAFKRACSKLEKSGWVCVHDQLVWIPRTRAQTLKGRAEKASEPDQSGE